jgi:hypothetical protein
MWPRSNSIQNLVVSKLVFKVASARAHLCFLVWHFVILILILIDMSRLFSTEPALQLGLIKAYSDYRLHKAAQNSDYDYEQDYDYVIGKP